MFWVVIKQISFEHDIQKYIFTPDYLRRMIAVHYINTKMTMTKNFSMQLEKACLHMDCPLLKGKVKDQVLSLLKSTFNTSLRRNHGEMLHVYFCCQVRGPAE